MPLMNGKVNFTKVCLHQVSFVVKRELCGKRPRSVDTTLTLTPGINGP